MPPGKLLATARVNTNNTVSLPKEVREKLGVKPGDQILFIEDSRRIIIAKGPLEVDI